MTEEPDTPNERHVVELVSLEEQNDVSMRAIGKYFAAFSSLVALMRQILTDQIAHDERSYRLTQLALGSLTAQQIADPFFAMCRALSKLQDHERKIEVALRGQVNEEIKRRNRIAHGDWRMVGWAEASQVPDEPVATLVRVKASDVRQPFKYDSLTAETIELYAAEVEELELLVVQWGLRCTIEGAYSPPQAAESQDSLELYGTANNRRVRLKSGARPYLYSPRDYKLPCSASRSS